MSKYYLSYIWKNGKPVGQTIVKNPSEDQVTYRIISDPYGKRLSLEQYEGKKFSKLLYDSMLLDFRKLRPEFQTAWCREKISDEVQLVRDQDDRLVVQEVCEFEGSYCRACRLYSPHGFLLGVQKIFYVALGDSFNGVILYDAIHQPVLTKKYSLNEKTGDFEKLIETLC